MESQGIQVNFFQLQKKFPTEKSVIDHFIKIRYPDGITCNHCGSDKVYQRKKRPRIFDCNDCGNTFSVFKDTVFEKTTTDLRKWMYALHLFLNAKKGISAKQLEREIGVTYKTAWRMLKQIRIAMGNKEHEKFANTIIEMDETYIGGKPRKGNRRDKDDKPKRGRGTKKNPVVGVVDRENRKVHARVAHPDKEGRKLSGTQLLKILRDVCLGDKNTIITDEFRAYNVFAILDWIHIRIDHSKRYVDGIAHTNTVESFWAIVKRAVYGIYHHVSLKYLQHYIDEFCFRFNNRDENLAFDLVLKQATLIQNL